MFHNRITSVVLFAAVLALAFSAVAAPVYADDGDVKPVCTAKHGFFARLFGMCVEIKNEHTNPTEPVSAPVIDVEQAIDDANEYIEGVAFDATRKLNELAGTPYEGEVLLRDGNIINIVACKVWVLTNDGEVDTDFVGRPICAETY